MIWIMNITMDMRMITVYIYDHENRMMIAMLTNDDFVLNGWQVSTMLYEFVIAIYVGNVMDLLLKSIDGLDVHIFVNV